MSGYTTVIFIGVGGHGTATGTGTNVTGLIMSGVVKLEEKGLIISGQSVTGYAGRVMEVNVMMLTAQNKEGKTVRSKGTRIKIRTRTRIKIRIRTRMKIKDKNSGSR